MKKFDVKPTDLFIALCGYSLKLQNKKTAKAGTQDPDPFSFKPSTQRRESIALESVLHEHITC